MSLTIFGGALLAMWNYKTDKYNLFCWYHKAMAALCASIGFLDILNFYTEWINGTILNTVLAIFKITLLAGAIQVIYKWVKKQQK